MVYVSECPPESAGEVLSAIAESVVSPKMVAWEMADASVRNQSCSPGWLESLEIVPRIVPMNRSGDLSEYRS